MNPILLRIFVAFHLCAIVICSVPRPIGSYAERHPWIGWNERELKPKLWNYIYGLGIGQNWEMFALIDRYDDTWFDAELSTKDAKEIVALAHLSTTPLLERIPRARDLFFYETVSGTQNTAVLRSVAHYLVKNSSFREHATKDGVTVRFLSHQRPVFIYSSSQVSDYWTQPFFTTNIREVD